jgi:hypothetical protein
MMTVLFHLLQKHTSAAFKTTPTWFVTTLVLWQGERSTKELSEYFRGPYHIPTSVASLGAERDGIIAFLTERRAVSVSAIVATYLGKLDVSGIKAALLAIKSGQRV